MHSEKYDEISSEGLYIHDNSFTCVYSIIVNLFSEFNKYKPDTKIL